MRSSVIFSSLLSLSAPGLIPSANAQGSITVNIESPADGGTVIGNINITGTSSGVIGTGRVALSINGGPFVTASGTDNWSYSWDSNSVPDGNLSIQARARNFPGDPDTVIHTIDVVVENNGEGGEETLPFAYVSSVDEGICTGNIWLPPGIETATDVPLVIFFGGGEGDGQIHATVQSEARERGWIALGLAGRAWPPGSVGGEQGPCGYRTSMAYLNHPDPSIGPGQQDILDGIDWVISNYPVDEDRIYACGFSLGGRGTYMMGLKVPDRFAAIAPLAPAADMFDLDIRTSTTRESYPCRMALAGGVPGTSPMSATLRSIQSGRFLIENAYNLPVFHGHGTLDDLANNLPGNGGFLHGFHMTIDTSWSGEYVYEDKIFDFGHTPTLSELHVRHPDGYDFAYMFTPVGHAVDPKWLKGTDQALGQGVTDPSDTSRLLGAFDFFESHIRVNNPEHVVYKSYTDDLRKAYWVEIDISQPWRNQPGAIRAARDNESNRIDAELSFIDVATFDLTTAGLELDENTSLTVGIEPLVEPAYDPALDPTGEDLSPTIAVKGDFSALDGVSVMVDGLAVAPELLSFEPTGISVGPLPQLTDPTEIVFTGIVEPAGGFEAWMDRRGETDPLNEPTGSGINNLLTYVFGADLTPVPHDALPKAGFALLDTGSGPRKCFTLSIRRRNRATDSLIGVESTSNLRDWQDMTESLVLVETTDNGDGTSTSVLRESSPHDSPRYFRARATILEGAD